MGTNYYLLIDRCPRCGRAEHKIHVGKLSAGWQFSPWAAFNGNVQYDDGSELVGLYGRFRWIIRPGNDFYFVYTHNWYSEGDRFQDFEFTTVSRGATSKLSYTHRF